MATANTNNERIAAKIAEKKEQLVPLLRELVTRQIALWDTDREIENLLGGEIDGSFVEALAAAYDVADGIDEETLLGELADAITYLAGEESEN